MLCDLVDILIYSFDIFHKNQLTLPYILSIHPDLFRIESIGNVGKIYTTKVLDREQASSYRINVQAVLNNESVSVVQPPTQRRRKRATGKRVVKIYAHYFHQKGYLLGLRLSKFRQNCVAG